MSDPAPPSEAPPAEAPPAEAPPAPKPEAVAPGASPAAKVAPKDAKKGKGKKGQKAEEQAEAELPKKEEEYVVAWVSVHASLDIYVLPWIFFADFLLFFLSLAIFFVFSPSVSCSFERSSFFFPKKI